MVYEQFYGGIIHKLDIIEDHEDIPSNRYPIGLLTNINTIMFQFQTTKYMPHAIHGFNRRLYLIRKYRDNTVT